MKNPNNVPESIIAVYSFSISKKNRSSYLSGSKQVSKEEYWKALAGIKARLIKMGLSPFKFFFICLTESLSKMMKNAFISP